MKKLLKIVGLLGLAGLVAACSASFGGTLSIGKRAPSGVTVADPQPSPSPTASPSPEVR